MPLIIKLKPEVTLPGIWMSKEEFEELYQDREKFLEGFEEDPYSFVEDCGGIKELIISARWEDDDA